MKKPMKAQCHLIQIPSVGPFRVNGDQWYRIQQRGQEARNFPHLYHPLLSDVLYYSEQFMYFHSPVDTKRLLSNYFVDDVSVIYQIFSI